MRLNLAQGAFQKLMAETLSHLAEIHYLQNVSDEVGKAYVGRHYFPGTVSQRWRGRVDE